MSDIDDKTPEMEALEAVGAIEAEALGEGEVEAAKTIGTNEYFRNMMNRNFLEYASYAIRDRAIPNVDDGLKPVQRRILWAMHKVDDGRTNKASFVVGEVMGKYHPHGDASIKDALVVLANKEYFIEKQGNFGNIFTGSSAAAPRYIECGLTPLAREVLFNDDITEMVETYDGRNLEPVVLPVKIPSLLMLGSDGIAVGMATRIMPHNFNELLRAQISELNGESYELYPDFLQGGLMDAREYSDGSGKITLRARIEIVDRKLIIREIPATTTTESLIASIEKAAEKNKIKISSVNDYTAQNVEIEVVPTRGYDPEKALQALYMYTDCSISISSNLTVIRDFRPAVMTVTEVIKRNTGKLLEYLQSELEIALHKQNELFHAKTLAQIFFENRIYKRIEECEDEASEYAEVRDGLNPFREMLRRDVTDEDIDRLLALPVRRIARFDIEKNQKDLREIEKLIKELKHHLGHLKPYAIKYLEDLIAKYGHAFPRRTEIVESLRKIDRKSAALNNIKIGLDRKNGYIGTGIKSDDTLLCNEFDHLLCIEKNGRYKIIDLPPDKLFIGKFYECRRHDPETEFGVVYSDGKSGKYYGKRSTIGSFIKDKEYTLCPAGCKLELVTPRADAVYQLVTGGRGAGAEELNLLTLPVRTPKARGLLICSKKVTKITHLRYLEEAEAAQFRSNATEEATEEDIVEIEEQATVEVASDGEVTEIIAVEIEVTETLEETVKPEKKRMKAEEPEPEPVEVEETVVEPESVKVETPVAAEELISVPHVKPVKPVKAKAPKPEPKAEKAPEAEPEPPSVAEDDLGIVQPEFGF